MKCDPILGKKIHEHLVALKLETPMIKTEYSSIEKKSIIEESVTNIMNVLGLDLSNDSMANTPKRIAKMYVDEVMYGLEYEKFPRIMTFENSFHDAGMVVERNIQVKSLCSHHLVPTIGQATIGYIPDQKVIGLSKLNRIVDFFARRPQEQERFGVQLKETLKYILETPNVAVYIKAKHYCVSWRGVEDDTSEFVTANLSGIFLSDSIVRNEFYSVASMK